MAKKDDDDSTTAAPDPWALIERLTTAIEALGKRQEATPNDRVAEVMETLSTALARVAEAQTEGSKLIASETRRAHRPSNEVVPQVSVFNRRGTNLADNATGPRKVPLKCIMMLPWIAEWESLTREEVDLLNLLQPGEYAVKRIDNSKVRVTIAMEYRVDGKTPSRLIVNHDTAFNNDNFRMMPPLVDYLRQILRQHEPDIASKSRAVITDEEEEALIEAGELSVSV